MSILPIRPKTFDNSFRELRLSKLTFVSSYVTLAIAASCWWSRTEQPSIESGGDNGGHSRFDQNDFKSENEVILRPNKGFSHGCPSCTKLAMYEGSIRIGGGRMVAWRSRQGLFWPTFLVFQ